MLFNREPALIIGAIGALLAVAMGFGLDISETQSDLIMAAIPAVIAVAIRQRVYSPASGDAMAETIVDQDLKIIELSQEV